MEYVHLACAHLPLLAETLGAIDQIVARTAAAARPRSSARVSPPAPSLRDPPPPCHGATDSRSESGSADELLRRSPISLSALLRDAKNKSGCNNDDLRGVNEVPAETPQPGSLLQSSAVDLMPIYMPDLAVLRWWIRSVTPHSRVKA